MSPAAAQALSVDQIRARFRRRRSARARADRCLGYRTVADRLARTLARRFARLAAARFDRGGGGDRRALPRRRRRAGPAGRQQLDGRRGDPAGGRQRADPVAAPHEPHPRDRRGHARGRSRGDPRKSSRRRRSDRPAFPAHPRRQGQRDDRRAGVDQRRGHTGAALRADARAGRGRRGGAPRRHRSITEAIRTRSR